MPRIAYERQNFRRATLRIIDLANAFCEREYRRGLELSARQVYYYFISSDLFPNSWIDVAYNRKHRLDDHTKNTLKNYNRLKVLLMKARMAGLLDWNFIVDRGRFLRGLQHWDSPQKLIESASETFHIDKWADQPNRVEVWIEKDALVGVLQHVCQPEDVNYFSCRGFNSSSEMWGGAQRIRHHLLGGQRFILLQLGDHDPSGMDITRVVREDMADFLVKDMIAQEHMPYTEAHDLVANGFEHRRIALNMVQVDRFQPPPNPAKRTDARYRSYREEFGEDSWELDALRPELLERIVRANIKDCRDDALWKAAVEKEKGFRTELSAIAKNYDAVVNFAKAQDAPKAKEGKEKS